MEEKNSKSLKIFLYVSVWVIIWGSVASLIDFPLLKNNFYKEGDLYQYLTFSITAFFSIISAKFIYKKIKL
tara:strand:- start:932 stop:1144 length:213 start_codon:yes stop_codon:yes gene_type:complete